MDQLLPSKSAYLKVLLITGFSLLLGICFNYFFYGKLPGLAFPIFIALVLGGLFLIARVYKKMIRKDILWLILPLAFFASMVFVRDNPALALLNLVVCTYLLLLIVEKVSGQKIKEFLLWKYFDVLLVPFRFIVPFFDLVADFVNVRKFLGENGLWLKILKGTVMALPILVIFIALFASADLVFQKYLFSFLSFDLDMPNTSRWVLVFFVTVIFMGAYAYIFREKHDLVLKPDLVKNPKIQNLGIVEATVFLGLVEALFLLFILVQVVYFFGGVQNISMEGFTYAEYVHKGFFELIFVAMISFAILWATEQGVVRNDAGHKKMFKIVSGVLILQVGLIMLSAFSRISLYEDAYGVTGLRFFCHAFIIWLAVLFGLLLVKICIHKGEHVFVLRAAWSLLMFCAFLNLVNPDAYIARQNIRHAEVTGKLDVAYLKTLSDDALPEIFEILKMQNSDFKYNLGCFLYREMDERDGAPFIWQSLNLSRLRAQSLFVENKNILTPASCYGSYSSY